MCGGCKDRETHAPMRLEDAISVPRTYAAERSMCGGCKDRETHAPMRLEDATSVTPYIHSGAEDVRGCAWGGGDKNKGDEARLRHLKK